MKTFAFASLLAAASALPAAPQVRGLNNTNPDISHFQIMSLRSGSPVHFGRINAAHNSLFLNLPEQDASCYGGGNNEPAYFQHNKAEKTLWLYATANPRQQVYVDRSGMGQGKIGYVTGAEPTPRDGEREGWVVDEFGNLSFDGTGLLACPNSIDGAWSIWLAGVEEPAGNKDCLGFSARTVSTEDPLDCYYSN